MERDFRINWPALVEEAVRRRRQLNLTQKQLATLAKVSAPTISRFEQNAKDIQLSTVLAILEVLGMTDNRTLTFPDDSYREDFNSRAIMFWAQGDDERRILCRISREALDDYFSNRGKLPPETAFATHRGKIEALARRKYLLGQLEPDGSISIKTDDVST
jgi:transcriptional regulator with XRE-family HTH domain